MEILNSTDLKHRKYTTIRLPERYGALLGDIEPNVTIFIWGSKGSGKSTFSVGVARCFASFGKVLYVSAEEGAASLTLKEKIERLKADHKNLLTGSFTNLDALQKAISEHDIKFVVLDSVSYIGGNSKKTLEFQIWCKNNGVGVIYIAHAQKAGEDYKGDSKFGHDCDIVIRVAKSNPDDPKSESHAQTQKNRYQELCKIAVDFTGETNYGGDRKMPKSKQYAKSEPTDAGDADLAWTKSDQAKANNKPHDYNEMRENPSSTLPYAKLGRIIDKHKIRTPRKLNELLGVRASCRLAGEPIAVIASRDGSKTAREAGRQYKLTILKNGKVYDEICMGDFAGALLQLKQKHSNLSIEIDDEAHAKKVMGVRDYNAYHKAISKSAKKEATSTTKTATKPLKAASTASKPKVATKATTETKTASTRKKRYKKPTTRKRKPSVSTASKPKSTPKPTATRKKRYSKPTTARKRKPTVIPKGDTIVVIESDGDKHSAVTTKATRTGGMVSAKLTTKTTTKPKATAKPATTKSTTKPKTTTKPKATAKPKNANAFDSGLSALEKLLASALK